MAKARRYSPGMYLKQFGVERLSREYLENLRWQNGYVCPECGCSHAYLLKNGRYQCAQCRHQTSVTAGTVLHTTHMPLTKWFLQFYFACHDKWGISTVQLVAMLGKTYKTAWYMLNGFVRLWDRETKRTNSAE